MKKLTFTSVALALLLFVSCESVTPIVSLTAFLATETGLMSLDTAEAMVLTADSISTAAHEFTPEEEYHIGRAVAATILSKYPVYQNPRLQVYLNNICHTLAATSPVPELYRDYSIVILDTDEINAFSTIGGHILITLGMLKCTSSEDEIAAVIAHEMAHIQLKHGVTAIKNSRIANAVFTTATSTVTILADDDSVSGFMNRYDQSIKELVYDLTESGYSKDAEYEADEYAVSLLAESGYKASCMDTMLALIQSHEKRDSGVAKTHPSTSSRRRNVKYVCRKYKNYVDTSFARTARFEAFMLNIHW